MVAYLSVQIYGLSIAIGYIPRYEEAVRWIWKL